MRPSARGLKFFRGELSNAFRNPEVVRPDGLTSLGKSPAADGFRHIVLQCSFVASMWLPAACSLLRQTFQSPLFVLLISNSVLFTLAVLAFSLCPRNFRGGKKLIFFKEKKRSSETAECFCFQPERLGAFAQESGRSVIEKLERPNPVRIRKKVLVVDAEKCVLVGIHNQPFFGINRGSRRAREEFRCRVPLRCCSVQRWGLFPS